tara:strand:- start:758 stop:2062 length:1305 start_codon:yes stop_codon:yes gene_type:complete
MAINTPKEDLPLWLQEIMVARGIYPDINIGVSSDASPFVVPPRIRREYEDVWGGDGDDILMGSSGENDRLNDESSSNIIETLKGLLSSDTDNLKFDLGPFASKAAIDQTSSGNSFIDGAANLVSGIGQSVTDGLSKLGGLFSGSFSNPFDFDYTPSISDPTSPMGLLGGAATALSDPHLSTSQKVGQALGGGLGAAASLVMPGALPLSLFAAAMQQKGAHHDFNPSTDYNLNFDTRSGRTDWGSTTDGAGGVQYGSLNNENMIEDLAEKDPNFEIQLDGGKGGYITAGDWVDVNNAYKDIDSSVAFIGPQNFSEALIASADAPGTTFQSFGGGTLGEALTEYGQTGTGAIMNRAGAMLGPNAGYNETRDLADQLAAQADLATSGLFDVDTGTGAATVSDIASGLSSYTGADLGTDTSGLDASTDDDPGNWDFDF